jgi:hypothetical protein
MLYNLMPQLFLIIAYSVIFIDWKITHLTGKLQASLAATELSALVDMARGLACQLSS